MKRDNKGYTLVEIIIVIAIVAVVAGGSTVSFNIIHNARVSTSSKTIHSNAKAVRLNNMTKQKTKYIHLFRKDGMNYIYIDDKIEVDTNAESDELGNNSMTIQYSKDGKNYTNISSMTLSWGRNGEFKAYNGTGGSLGKVTNIKCKNKTKSSVLTFSQVTGKVSN